MKRSPMRRTGFKRRAGKKTIAWNNARAILKLSFAEVGITTCEMRRPGCWIDNGLGFAHSKKRDDWSEPGDIWDVILACNICHDYLDLVLAPISHQLMYDEVHRIIDNREVQITI